MVLPDCSDRVLLKELASVVSVGWSLPSTPSKSRDVAHLLLLADRDRNESYGVLAERFLRLLDKALLAAYTEERLTEEEWLGLRILFGLHVDYRSEDSPTKRKVAAATYLVKAWRDYSLPRTSDDEWRMAESFRRKHQPDKLRLALDCLRATYGQEQGPSDHAEALVLHEYTYVVDDHRRIRLERCSQAIRVIHDGYKHLMWWESLPDEDAAAESFCIVKQPADNQASFETARRSPLFPDSRLMSIEFAKAYAAGDIFTLTWEREHTFTPDAPDGGDEAVSTQAPNDNYVLSITVIFEGDRPRSIWAYDAEHDTVHFEARPYPDEVLIPDQEGTVHYQWMSPSRRISYGIQWRWEEDVMVEAYPPNPHE